MSSASFSLLSSFPAASSFSKSFDSFGLHMIFRDSFGLPLFFVTVSDFTYFSGQFRTSVSINPYCSGQFRTLHIFWDSLGLPFQSIFFGTVSDFTYFSGPFRTVSIHIFRDSFGLPFQSTLNVSKRSPPPEFMSAIIVQDSPNSPKLPKIFKIGENWSPVAKIQKIHASNFSSPKQPSMSAIYGFRPLSTVFRAGTIALTPVEVWSPVPVTLALATNGFAG